MRIIDKLVEQWHEDKETTTPIHEYCGLTLSEYDDFVNSNRVPDRLPILSAEHKIHESKPGTRGMGALAPPGHRIQPGYIVPAKREP